MSRAVLASALVFASTLVASARPVGDAAAPRVSVCFAPGTSAAYRSEIEAFLAGGWTTKGFSSTRWHATATDGPGLVRGQRVTLTWAIVPDGTSVPGRFGGATAPSNLRTFLNGIYGDSSKWLPLFEKTFARWSELTGLRYVNETADDGASLSSAQGVLGVRADVRIGGVAIDGDLNVLAYNSYPDDGDMVIDTSDSWFRGTALDSRRLRNVVSHEHGHGIGLDHACPVDGTKLMEPNVSTSFAGPQHDDVLVAQRLYGDPDEKNDSTGTATDLGEPENETKIAVSGVGIDDATDTDLFAFTAQAGMNADVTLRPAGKAYLLGQEADGKCGAGQSVDTRTRADLRLALLNPDGSVLATADATRAGGDETLLDVPLTRGAGRYFVRVRNAGEELNQMYSLDLVVGLRGEKPVAAADAVETWEMLPVAVPVLANDSGLADAPIKLRLVSTPTSGRALLDGDRIVYVPARGFVGDARFSYEVKDVHTETATAECVVTVSASARAGNARLDADGDGYPDEFETSRATAADDAQSRPGEDVSAGAAPLVVDGLKLVLRTNRVAFDELAVVGRVPVAAGFEPEGRTVVASVAGVVREFVLDKHGRSVERAASAVATPAFRLRLRKKKGVVVAGDVRFDLRLVRGDFASSWADEAIDTTRTLTREARAATLFLLFDGRTRVATVPLAFTARKGATGVATRVK